MPDAACLTAEQELDSFFNVGARQGLDGSDAGSGIRVGRRAGVSCDLSQVIKIEFTTTPSGFGQAVWNVRLFRRVTIAEARPRAAHV